MFTKIWESKFWHFGIGYYIQANLKSIDIFANTLFGPLFNLIGDGKLYGSYGKSGETISFAMGKEHSDNDLNEIEVAVASVLSYIDEDHVERVYNETIAKQSQYTD